MPRSDTAFLVTVAVLVGACSNPESPERATDIESVIESVVIGSVDTLATSSSDLLAVAADLHRLHDGRLLVSDEMAHVIQVFGRDGSHLATLGGAGQGPGEFNRPGSLQSRGDTLLVVDHLNGRIQVLSAEGEYLTSVPVTGGYGPVLTPDGLVIQPTLGIDSVMAVVRDLEGEERARLGSPAAPVSRMIRISELKAEIEAGGVPDIFRNTALPVGDGAGSVWLYTPALARVERYDLDGGQQLSITLDDPGFQEERGWFRERNRGAEGTQLFPLELLRSSRAVEGRLWVLLGTGPDGPARIAILTPGGEVEARLRFTEVRGAGDFLPDPGAGEIFFTIPERAELIRIRADELAEVP
jgi:hypothetical protein